MSQLIDGKKILWPDEPSPVFYKNRTELDDAIATGAAPKNLRRDFPDLDFWVGKSIGRNMPRRKKLRTELKRLRRPLSTWIVPSAPDVLASAFEESRRKFMLTTSAPGQVGPLSVLRMLFAESQRKTWKTEEIVKVIDDIRGC